MDKKVFSIPISKFSIDESQGDLTPVRIQVCHDKDNPNGSYFETDSLTKAENSIKNKPIVAAYQINDEEEIEDFKGHEIEYKIMQEDGSFEITPIYIEQPIGAIPESCDFSIEEIDNRNWICVNGYLYNTYCQEAVDLLKNNDGTKKISMEIEIIDGEQNEKDGYYHIKEFKFLGITVLGDEYPPAMGNNATISLFTEGKQSKEFAMKFTKILNEIKEIGGKNMGESKKKFSLSSKDLRNRLSEQLNDITYDYTYSWGEVETCRQYFLADILPEDNIVIVEDEQDGYKTYGISYTLEGDQVVLNMDTKERYIRGDWRKFEGQDEDYPLNEHQSQIFNKEIEHFKQEAEDIKKSFVATETEEYKELKVQFEKLEKDKEELEAIKANFEKEAREKEESELFEKFKDLESVEGFSELKENAQNFSIQDLEKELYVLLGKKSFSMNNTKKDPEISSFKIDDANSATELSPAEKRYGKL